MPKITEMFSQMHAKAVENRQRSLFENGVQRTMPIEQNLSQPEDGVVEESYDEEAAIEQAVKESLKTAPRNRSNTYATKKSATRNNSQYIDPWLSEVGAQDLITPSESHGSHGGSPRRTSFGKTAQEPFRLMSTAPSVFRDDSRRSRFASPRRQMHSSEPTEIIGSDDEELGATITDGSHCQDGRVPRQQENTQRKQPIIFPQTESRKRLVQSSKLNTINLISSGEDEPEQQPVTTRQKAAPVILRDSSDDDQDELSRDKGKDTFKKDRPKKRASAYPTAVDTIPRLPVSPSATSTSPAGTTKMPWSIPEGPEGDIVLSTPKSKQRIRHYDMVRDSEDDEQSEVEPIIEQWSRSRRQSSVASNHLGLPKIDSISGTKKRDSPARALVSDSEGEQGEATTLLGFRSKANGSATDVATSNANNRAMMSSPNKHATSRVSKPTRLTKPRRLVLDVPSDLESSQDVMTTTGEHDPKEVEESHRRLRGTLLFEEEEEREDSELGTPTPRPIIEHMSRKVLKATSPPPPFPVFQRATKQGKPKESDEDHVLVQESNDEYDEPLDDPRIRRRSARMGTDMTSPPKRIRLTEAIPRFQEPELESSPVEEIEGFSDESQRVRPIVRNEDRTRQRYSGLRFVDLSNAPVAAQWPEKITSEARTPSPPSFGKRASPVAAPIVPGRSLERCPLCSVMMPADKLAAHVEEELQAKDREEQHEIERQDQEMALELERAFQTQDALFEEDESGFFQTQRPDHEHRLTQGRRPHSGRTEECDPITPTKDNARQRGAMISVDTPTRQVRNMTLNSPPGIKQRVRGKNVGLQKNASSGLSSDETGSQFGWTDPIEISQGDSASSQSAFVIQPGQNMTTPVGTQSSARTAPVSSSSSTGDAAIYSSSATYPPAPYFSTRAIRQTKGAGPLPSSESLQANTKVIEEDETESKDESDDDDMDDFMQQPGPSLQNRLSRVKLAQTTAKDSVSPAKQKSREIKTKTPSANENDFIQLDDTEDEKSTDISHTQAELPRRRFEAKSKSTVLENILPAPARERRQQMLKEQKELAKLAKSRIIEQEEEVEHDYEIEVGRRRPVAEKLWNKEDDLFDSEKLDHRQVRGVGLGGIVGGIGAIPGKLTMSKVTKSAAGSAKPLSQNLDEFSSRLSRDRQHSGGSGADRRHPQDDPLGDPPAFEFDDADYGFQSQDWWEAQVNSQGRSSEGAIGGEWEEEYDDGDEDEEDDEQDGDGEDLLDDLVDLRARRDDPSLAMYFAQLQPNRHRAENDDDNREPSKGKGRGRGRGGRGKQAVKGQLTFGAGVGPMTLGRSSGAGSSSSAGPPPSTGFSLEAFGHISQSAGPRGEDAYGARRVTFGGQATTANGSLAIRSKPTPSFSERRGRGGGAAGKYKSKGRNFWAGRARGRGGRGRGRGRGGA